MDECSDSEEDDSFSSCAEIYNELLSRIDDLTNKSRCQLVCIGKDFNTIEVNLYATVNEYLNERGYNRFNELYINYIKKITYINTQIKRNLNLNNKNSIEDGKPHLIVENSEEKIIAQKGKYLLLRIQELDNALKLLIAENRSLRKSLEKFKDDGKKRISKEEVLKVKGKRQANVANELKQNKVLKQYQTEINKITKENKELSFQILKLQDQLKIFDEEITKKLAVYNSQSAKQINKPKQKPIFSPRRLPENPLPPIPKIQTQENVHDFEYDYEEEYEYEYEEDNGEWPAANKQNLPLKPPEKPKYAVSMPTIVTNIKNPRVHSYFPSHPTALQDPWIKRKLAMAENKNPKEISKTVMPPGEEILTLIGKFRVLLKDIQEEYRPIEATDIFV